MADNRRFQQGSGSYECVICGALTRETGEGESEVQMCRTDYLLDGLYNSWMDGSIEQAEYERRAAALEAQRPTKALEVE